MKTRKLLIHICLVFLFTLITSGCGRVANDYNFTLEKGTVVKGPLLIVGQNAILDKGSSVKGPVIMLCCDLIVSGKVDGNVLLVAGNLQIEPHANVDGDIKVMSGNFSQ